MNSFFYLVPCFGIIALLFTMFKGAWVRKQPAGNERMKEISTYIADGAMAFLKAEYKILTYFVIIAAILLGIMGASNANSHWSIALAFVVGAFFSAPLPVLSVCVSPPNPMSVLPKQHVPV